MFIEKSTERRSEPTGEFHQHRLGGHAEHEHAGRRSSFALVPLTDPFLKKARVLRGRTDRQSLAYPDLGEVLPELQLPVEPLLPHRVYQFHAGSVAADVKGPFGQKDGNAILLRVEPRSVRVQPSFPFDGGARRKQAAPLQGTNRFRIKPRKRLVRSGANQGVERRCGVGHRTLLRRDPSPAAVSR
jgi:hypothetical protein